MATSSSDPSAGSPSRRAVLTGSLVTGGALIASAGAATPAAADPAAPAGAAAGPRPATTQPPDAELRSLLRQVDARRVEAIVRRLVAFGTRHTLSSQTDPNRGIGAAANWIFQEFQRYAATSGGRMTVELQSYVQAPAPPRIPTATTITNVIATVRGVEAPDRIYVVTGHYDSRVTDVNNAVADAPGADDDASGVAVVMEVARLLATRPLRATVVFAAVAGEEQGLFGSGFMARQMKAAAANVQGMFSYDIVGSSVGDDGNRDPHTVRYFAEGVPTSETPQQANIRRAVGGENDSSSRQLARFVHDVAENAATGMRIRVIYRRDRYLRGSDHISFLEQGYPAGRFTEPRENFAHQHQDVRVENGQQFGDLPEFCDFQYIARVARVNAAVLWSLAQGPGTPTGVQILTNRLTNDTDLVWTRGPEPDLAGYEVVWRETTEPVWTHVVRVGDVTTARIDLSKDNVFFGVRAIDRRGRHSPVAFPLPST
jgi:hypothetical protein